MPRASEQDGPRDTAGASDPPAGKSLDKRSWDYVLRSGLAGGVAGCAVSGAEKRGTRCADQAGENGNCAT